MLWRLLVTGQGKSKCLHLRVYLLGSLCNHVFMLHRVHSCRTSFCWVYFDYCFFLGYCSWWSSSSLQMIFRCFLSQFMSITSNGFRRLSWLTTSHTGHFLVFIPIASIFTLYLPKSNWYFLGTSCFSWYTHIQTLFFHFLCIYLVSSTVSYVK